MKKIFIQFYRFTDSPTYLLEVGVDEKLTRDQITNFIYDVAGDFCKVSDSSSWSIIEKHWY